VIGGEGGGRREREGGEGRGGGGEGVPGHLCRLDFLIYVFLQAMSVHNE
jgi:hypothetical protein